MEGANEYTELQRHPDIWLLSYSILWRVSKTFTALEASITNVALSLKETISGKVFNEFDYSHLSKYASNLFSTEIAYFRRYQTEVTWKKQFYKSVNFTKRPPSLNNSLLKLKKYRLLGLFLACLCISRMGTPSFTRTTTWKKIVKSVCTILKPHALEPWVRIPWDPETSSCRS